MKSGEGKGGNLKRTEDGEEKKHLGWETDSMKQKRG